MTDEPFSLFTAADDPDFNALFHLRTGEQWSKYCWGYKRAADRLVETARETEIDLLIYPIIFLYRQYVELRLKELYTLTGTFLEESMKYPKVHGLGGLWTELLSRLERIWPVDDFEDEAELRALCTRVIEEIDKVDRHGVVFRYPESGHEVLNGQDIGVANLKYLKEIFGRVSVLLDGDSYELSERLEVRWELLAADWLAQD